MLMLPPFQPLVVLRSSLNDLGISPVVGEPTTDSERLLSELRRKVSLAM